MEIVDYFHQIVLESLKGELRETNEFLAAEAEHPTFKVKNINEVKISPSITNLGGIAKNWNEEGGPLDIYLHFPGKNYLFSEISKLKGVKYLILTLDSKEQHIIKTTNYSAESVELKDLPDDINQALIKLAWNNIIYISLEKDQGK